MLTPHDKSAVRCLLGMIKFFGPHILNMAAVLAPLREVVKTNVHFQWSITAEKAWNAIKAILASEPVLQFFNPAMKSTIQADASQHGLGACLM